MSIQSLTGYAGKTPQQPATPRPEVAPAAAPAVKVPETPVRQTAPPDPEQLHQAVEKVKAAMSSKTNALQFSLDDDTGKTVVKVVDGETGELIRQIPSEEMVEIARSLDKMQGMLLKQRA